MTTAEMSAIKQRYEKATAGKWFAILEGRDQTGGSSFIITGVHDADDVHNKNRGEDFYITGAGNHDLDFIAHARQDIPQLVQEIERLTKIINEQSFY
jgi:hypothetical protein